MDNQAIKSAIAQKEIEISKIDRSINTLLYRQSELEVKTGLTSAEAYSEIEKLTELRQKINDLNDLKEKKIKDYISFSKNRTNKYAIRKVLVDMPEKDKPKFAKKVDYSTFLGNGKKNPKILSLLLLAFIISLIVNVIVFSLPTIVISCVLGVIALGDAIIPSKYKRNKHLIRKMDKGIENTDIVEIIMKSKKREIIEISRRLKESEIEYEKISLDLEDSLALEDIDEDLSILREIENTINKLENSKKTKVKEVKDLRDCLSFVLAGEAKVETPKQLIFRNNFSEDEE